ncbi:MAG TPA: site-specific integrase, partial [Nocardioidaceae bacterium]|nr:site-specific integrase [Nocardioidaceae bacterium]
MSRPSDVAAEWDDWISDWLLSLSGDDAASSTRSTYERGVRQLVKFLTETNGMRAPGEVRRRDVEGFMAHLVATGKAESTRRVRLMSLRSFFGWLIDEPWTPLEVNPAAGIKAPMPELPRVEVVPDADLSAVLSTCAAGTKASFVDLR